MLTLKTISELTRKIQEIKSQKKTIGFVPTMGFLHKGHLNLIQESIKSADFTVVSIFVNPAQFNDPKDFEKYPRNTEEDIIKCQDGGADMVFLPAAWEIYPAEEAKVELRIPHLMKNLCATTRPGHFEGVLLVISKFFHLIQPDIAFFGKKDYQQYLIVKEFSKILHFPVIVKGIDTIREEDGLAMSSRNARLNPMAREAANLIYRALKISNEMIESNELDVKIIKEVISDIIHSSPLTKIDYLEIVNPISLEPLERIHQECLISTAVFVDGIRLIDNILCKAI
ncbi:MAG: pantoate--beta-alanine ligase [Leptospiraceae bacterium]|nr:pantoate--beta-alanine ligase [Leptospiraceae bacterium]MCP5495138.1 pantoate--beta-alanine ligase [Leptospiraceae bacterium]